MEVQEVSKLARASAVAATVVLTAFAAQPAAALAGSDPALTAASSDRAGVVGDITHTVWHTGTGWGDRGRHSGGRDCSSEKGKHRKPHQHEHHTHHRHHEHHQHGGQTCRCPAPVHVPPAAPPGVPPAPSHGAVHAARPLSAPVQARAVAVPVTGTDLPVGQGLVLVGLGAGLLAAGRRRGQPRER